MRNFALETYFSKWEFTAKHHLTASDVQSMTVAELLSIAGLPSDHLSDLYLGYTETWGAPDLRQAIADTYTRIDAQNVLCFSGAEEGVYATMRGLLSAQDHAIVVVPNYQAAETIPLDICAVSGVPLDADNNWQLDLDALEKSIQANTKLVSVCFPNNPTGAIIAAADFRLLIELCRKHDLYLFSDEVYRGMELDASKRIEQAADVYEKGLSLNVMSKAYGLPGLRIGWLASQDQHALQKIEQYKHYLSICNSAPSERLAVIALSVRDTLLARNMALINSNLDKLETFFAGYPQLFDWQRPDGSCIAFPKFTGRGGVEAFCASLVEQNGVLLLPASIYRSELLATPNDRFRIGFGRESIDAGLSAFDDFIQRNLDQLSP